MTKKASTPRNKKQLTDVPPKYLGKIAAALWRKLVHVLQDEQGAKSVDSSLVELYCSQYEIYRKAYDHIKEHGEVQAIYKPVQNNLGDIIDKSFQGFKRNPMTQIYNDAVKNLAKIGAELGLSPKSRAELLEVLPKKKADKSTAEQMKELLNGKQKD